VTTLKAYYVPVKSLGEEDREKMLELMQRYYEGVTPEIFRKDLEKKTAAIVLREPGKKGAIQGFSTVLHSEMLLDGKRIRCLFSGDTIIEKKYWGQRGLQKKFALRFIIEGYKKPWMPLYWCLISKGYKTYLLMSNNFVEFYPRVGVQIPAKEKRVMDAFYGSLYPENYRSNEGLVRFGGATCKLRAAVAPISESLLNENRNIRFFQARNPEWHEGVELACLAKFTLITPIIYSIKLAYKIFWVRPMSRRLAASRPSPELTPALGKE
jgi:hypothetical protein